MGSNKYHIVGISLLLLMSLLTNSCFRYSMTGTSIPSDVSSVYIPFFPDQSNSGLGNLSSLLNDALVDRFVNSTRLQLANSQGNADAILEGTIVSYENSPYTIGGNDQANENQVSITVQATFKYAQEEKPEWSQQRFQNQGFYDPSANPIEGENTAAETALQKIADNMFNEAVGQW